MLAVLCGLLPARRVGCTVTCYQHVVSAVLCGLLPARRVSCAVTCYQHVMLAVLCGLLPARRVGCAVTCYQHVMLAVLCGLLPARRVSCAVACYQHFVSAVLCGLLPARRVGCAVWLVTSTSCRLCFTTVLCSNWKACSCVKQAVCLPDLADMVCPRLPPTLTFDHLTLKLVCESHLRWGTFLQNLGMLGLCILELFAMYTTDRQTDGRMDGQKQCLLPLSLWSGAS